MAVVFCCLWVCAAFVYLAKWVVVLFGKHRMRQAGFGLLVATFAVFGAMKPEALQNGLSWGQEKLGGGAEEGFNAGAPVMVLNGGAGTTNEIWWLDASLADWDGDEIPDAFERRVYMDWQDEGDGESVRFDGSMTAFEKYGISADWRVADTSGDGIPDWWKLEYGFDVLDDIFEEDTDGDGLTNWQEYVLKFHPRRADSNFDGVDDGAAVARGFTSDDWIDVETEDAPDDVTFVSVSLSGAAAPYALVRIGPVAHVGRGTKVYALRTGAVYGVAVEQLPGMAAGTGLSGSVTITGVQGIVAKLPGFDGTFVLEAAPPENGGHAPFGVMSVNGGAPRAQIETWRLGFAEVDNGGCIHGSARVRMQLLSPTSGVVTNGPGIFNWSWGSATNYGDLERIGPDTVRVSVSGTAVREWRKLQATGRRKQMLECSFQPAANHFASGVGRAYLSMECCLASVLTENPIYDGAHENGHGRCCHCLSPCGCQCDGCCSSWTCGCGPVTGTFPGSDPENAPPVPSATAHILRLNNNWDQDRGQDTPVEDRTLGYIWELAKEQDFLPHLLSPRPVADGSCCGCRLHKDETYTMTITGISNGLRLYKPGANGPLPAGTQLSKRYWDEHDFFRVEGIAPGGWNREQRIVWREEYGTNTTIQTNHFVVGRAQLWGAVPGENNVLSSANRLRWPKQPENARTVFLNAYDPATRTAAIGMGVWAGSHPRGRARLEINGTGRFVVVPESGGWAATSNIPATWDATFDGESCLIIQCVEPGIAELTLYYSNDNANGVEYSDTLRVEGFALGLVPDYNHDMKIDEDDMAVYQTGRKFAWWVNSDHDIDEGNGCECNHPAEICSGSSHKPNHADSRVNGIRDYVDFLPMRLVTAGTPLLERFPPDQYAWYIHQPGHKVGWAVCPDTTPAKIDAHVLDRTTGFSYLYPLNRAAGNDPPSFYMPPVRDEDLDALFNQNALLMLEGKAAYFDDEPFRIEVRTKGLDSRVVLRTDIPLDIFQPSDFIRWANARDGQDVYETGDSTGYFIDNLVPWIKNGRKEIVYVHGYNITEEKAYGEAWQVFKKLYWTGSNARLTAFLWEGDQGYLGGNLIGQPDLTWDYHSNARHALEIAPLLATNVNDRTKYAAPPVVIAHSCGNVLASSAITEHNANVSVYFLLNAAVASEAYLPKEAAPVEPAMMNSNWSNFTTNGLPNKLFASEYYRYFPDDDPRSKLTWRGKFTNWRNTEVYNYYSSGDTVTGNIQADEGNDIQNILGNVLSGNIPSAWGMQEKQKGRQIFFGKGAEINSVLMNFTQYSTVYRRSVILNSMEEFDLLNLDGAGYYFRPGGWGFYYPNVVNRYSYDFYGEYHAMQRHALTNILDRQEWELRSFPIFGRPGGFETHATVLAQRYAENNLKALLAHSFPALSFSAGANEVGINARFSNEDDMESIANGWYKAPGNEGHFWEHGDFRDVALYYVQTLFQQIVEQGRMK